jgi:hypothetical protein
MAITVSILQNKFLRSVDPKQPKMSNLHFDLPLKLSQEEVHDFSGEVRNVLRGGAKRSRGRCEPILREVRNSPYLPSKSGHGYNPNPPRIYYIHFIMVLPSIVMSRISSYCTSKTRHCSIKFLSEDILMAKQSVRVREAGVDLNSSLEEFDSRVVLFL